MIWGGLRSLAGSQSSQEMLGGDVGGMSSTLDELKTESWVCLGLFGYMHQINYARKLTTWISSSSAPCLQRTQGEKGLRTQEFYNSCHTKA